MVLASLVGSMTATKRMLGKVLVELVELVVLRVPEW